MNRSSAHPDVKYAAIVECVKEVVLYGAADLEFWIERLAADGLQPSNNHGQADVLISATDLKWRGLRFREWTVSIGVKAAPADAAATGYYLAQAYNSSRLLAFSERALFKTPYDHGVIQVDSRVPAAIEVKVDGAAAFNAQMSGSASCLRSADEQWAGPIFLPHHQQLFYAVLAGQTDTYPFVSGADSLVIQPQPRAPIFHWLSASGFTAREWHIRSAARHAKSKTYARTA